MKILIKGAKILKRNAGKYEVTDGDIAVSGNRIFKIGKIPEDFIPERVIDGHDKFATPALINCHTHAYMSVFRNLADDLSFGDWLFGSIMPREDRMQSKDAEIGAKLSIIEMMKSGTGTYVDMHMFPHTSADACLESGMRGVITRGLAGELKDADGGGERRFREALEEISFYKNESRLTFMLAPHAIYTCGENAMRHAAELANDMGLGINLHLSETDTEFNDCLKNHSLTPTEYCDGLGLLNEKTIAAHCVKLAEKDLDILAKRKVNVASCPISNMKLGNGFAPIEKMYEKGINVTLGTDSAASNNTVNLFPDMRAFALVHKGKAGDALSVSANQVIDAVTYNAARALSLENGELREGALADIAIFDLNTPTFRPNNSLVSALAYSANGSEVWGLIIDGKETVSNGEILTLDCEKIYYDAEKVIGRL